MGLFDFLRKKAGDPETGDAQKKEDAAAMDIYSGMRVEVTAFDGRLLFVAKLMNLSGNTAQLHQYSATEPVQEAAEPVRVRIRGYHDHERKAVYMEGAISPIQNLLWQVEDLVVARIGNDRAFFRLDTNLDATATTFSGIGAGEKACRLLNISVGGARIASDFRYQMGDKFLLKVQLMEDREDSVMFCQVLRVIEKDDSKFEYGCQFLELSDSDQERITQNIFAAQRKQRERT